MPDSRNDDRADDIALSALRFDSAEVRALLESMPLMVAVFDASRRLAYGNSAYGRFIGADVAGCIGMRLSDYMGEKVQRAVDRAVGKALRGEQVKLEGWMPHPSGEPRFISRLYAPQKNESGAVTGYIVFMQDQSEQQRYRDDLFRQAYYDPITGLANRLLMLNPSRITRRRESRLRCWWLTSTATPIFAPALDRVSSTNYWSIWGSVCRGTAGTAIYWRAYLIMRLRNLLAVPLIGR